MSIDSTEYTSQSTHSSVSRAPPPPFSSQTFTQSQRKRPALSNLGIEVSLASDVKTPNTPTPNFTTEPLDSSDAVLKIRPTPPTPIQSNENTPRTHHHQQYHPQITPQQYVSQDSFHEPQLSFVFEALSDFQNAFDQKTHRIENLVQIVFFKYLCLYCRKSI